MPSLPPPRSTRAYDAFLKTLYVGARRRVEEITIPPVKAIIVSGNEPPASQQYQRAIAVLYGIAYTLKMGMKFGKLPRPRGYFDYRVGGLETLWWSTGPTLDISNPDTLRWQAYLMVPAFVTAATFRAAVTMASDKRPDLPYASAKLGTIREGRVVQMLHVGPYDQEEPTINAMLQYMAEHGLVMNGRHHEIYISDPRRTAPAKLKTVIRLPVKSERRKPR
jgi:hypothetical protein